mmetsp:Transcript_15730/g.47175  ORF Transcript_15730/g.47175 Transcript_15730/m.47175 type:complete len:253 (-) Transcript_15730:44-802(-)
MCLAHGRQCSWDEHPNHFSRHGLFSSGNRVSFMAMRNSRLLCTGSSSSVDSCTICTTSSSTNGEKRALRRSWSSDVFEAKVDLLLSCAREEARSDCRLLCLEDKSPWMSGFRFRNGRASFWSFWSSSLSSDSMSTGATTTLCVLVLKSDKGPTDLDFDESAWPWESGLWPRSLPALAISSLRCSLCSSKSRCVSLATSSWISLRSVSSSSRRTARVRTPENSLLAADDLHNGESDDLEIPDIAAQARWRREP